MRVAIVGCGCISRVHIDALREIDGLEICAVCDQDKWRAQEVAELVDEASVYTELGSLLQQERPDAVHVLTPPGTHAELAIQAMEAGCHVLVEKPMALYVKDADRMIAAAQKNRVALCTNHNYLFKPSIMRALKLVERGAIGQVVHVYGYYGIFGEEIFLADAGGRTHWARYLPGGAFTDFLPHLIYLQLAFLGQVDSVAGVTIVREGKAGGSASGLSALIQRPGVSGVMVISMQAKPYAKFVDIYGTKGIIHADLVREVCTIHRQRALPRMLSKVIYNIEDSVQLFFGTAISTLNVALGKLKNYPGLHRLVRQFYVSIENDRGPPVPGKEGKRMISVLEKIWAKSQAQLSYMVSTVPSGVSLDPQTNAERVIVTKGMPGKVLVTGATGFLGHRLVAALSRCGVNVVALVRDEGQVSQRLKYQAQLVCGDVRDPASIEKAMRDVAVVYHCAAITTNKASWAAHYETNILGSETVFKEASKAGVQRIIHVSSVVVYGLDRSLHDGLVDESAPYAHNPDRWAYYLRSKLEADKLAFSYWREAGLPVTVLRPGILYGPGGKRPIGCRFGQPGSICLLIGSGRNLLPFVYVDNVVDCLLLAAVSPGAVGEVYNVVDEPQVSVRDVIRQQEKITGERSRLISLPSYLLCTVARLLELSSGFTDSKVPPKATCYVIRSACADIRYDVSKAKRQLGWQPAVTLQEGLRRMLDNHIDQIVSEGR